MARWWVLTLLLALGVSGCAREEGPREVPVSKSSAPAGPTDPAAATRPPRAIATH